MLSMPLDTKSLVSSSPKCFKGVFTLIKKSQLIKLYVPLFLYHWISFLFFMSFRFSFTIFTLVTFSSFLFLLRFPYYTVPNVQTEYVHVNIHKCSRCNLIFDIARLFDWSDLISFQFCFWNVQDIPSNYRGVYQVPINYSG